MSESPKLAMGEVENAARWIADAKLVVVLSGAGISAESGVPTFRGEHGLWKHYRAEDLATPAAFARDPRLVWEWYGWRRELVGRCEPNAAHLAIAELAASRPGVRIVTQNVDGLHHMAAEAFGARGGAGRPLELHGSLFRVRCTSCAARRADREPIDASTFDALPRCERCASLLRPDIVWFGEALDPEIIGEAFRLAQGADVCLVVGTSGVVQPAASLAGATRAGGGRVIEVNPEPTPLTRIAHLSLRATAVASIPSLLRAAGD